MYEQVRYEARRRQVIASETQRTSVLTDLETLRDELILAARRRLMAIVGTVERADHRHVRGRAASCARLV